MRFTFAIVFACALVACAELKRAEPEVVTRDPSEPAPSPTTAEKATPVNSASDEDARAPVAGPRKLRAVSIASGRTHSCVIDQFGDVHCWGSSNQGAPTLYGETDAPPKLDALALALGASFSCALRANGKTTCWGSNVQGQLDVPEEDFTAITAGDYHVCGLRPDRKIRCWGANYVSQLEAPDGEFVKVDAKGTHTCALDTAGAMTCWGKEEEAWGGAAVNVPPPSGVFVDLGSAVYGNCGINAEHAIVCAGKDATLTTPPPGEWSAIALGHAHGCARKLDDSVLCWGISRYGEASAIDTKLVAISAGDAFTCGIRSDGTVMCQGQEYLGRVAVPAEFR